MKTNWRLWAGLLLYTAALVVLVNVNWRVALGVFLFVWGNNLVYTARLMEIARGLRG